MFGRVSPDCPDQLALPPHCHHTASALRSLLAHGTMRYRAQASCGAPNKQDDQTLCFAPCALLNVELWWQAVQVVTGDRTWWTLSWRTGLGRRRAAVADERRRWRRHAKSSFDCGDHHHGQGATRHARRESKEIHKDEEPRRRARLCERWREKDDTPARWGMGTNADVGALKDVGTRRRKETSSF